MRFDGIPIHTANVIIEAEQRLALSEPSEAEMRKRGYVLVHRKPTSYYRRMPR